MTPLHLLPSLDGSQLYRWESLEPILRGLGSIVKWEVGHHTTLPFNGWDFWCRYRNEEINVDLDHKLRALTLYSTSDTALAYALALQREYGGEIYLFAGDNIADAIALSQVSDAKDLRTRLQQPRKGAGP